LEIYETNNMFPSRILLGVTVSIENRRSDRRRVLKRVNISIGNQTSRIDCLLRNLSGTGAFLEFHGDILLPKQFLFHNDWDGFEVECEIVRRVGNSIGVRFIGEKRMINSTRKQVIELSPAAYPSPPRDVRQQSDVKSTDADGCVSNAATPARVPAKRRVFGKRGL